MFKDFNEVVKFINDTTRKFSKDFVTQNYRVEFSNRKRSSLASTHQRHLMGKPIEIKFVYNTKYLKANMDNGNHIELTVLHEIAHAIAGATHHHDKVWVACCKRIGGNGKRLAENVKDY